SRQRAGLIIPKLRVRVRGQDAESDLSLAPRMCPHGQSRGCSRDVTLYRGCNQGSSPGKSETSVRLVFALQNQRTYKLTYSVPRPRATESWFRSSVGRACGC